MKNDMIKKPFLAQEYTSEQVMELKKCADDPVYFMRKYLKVMHPKRGAIPFDLYPYQERAVKSFQENKDTIVMMGRQQGKCVFKLTTINTAIKPSGFKKFLLKLFFKKQYDLIFDQAVEAD
jgi:ATP-dependent helicase YprA (DUF1998 family)